MEAVAARLVEIYGALLMANKTGQLSQEQNMMIMQANAEIQALDCVVPVYVQLVAHPELIQDQELAQYVQRQAATALFHAIDSWKETPPERIPFNMVECVSELMTFMTRTTQDLRRQVAEILEYIAVPYKREHAFQLTAAAVASDNPAMIESALLVLFYLDEDGELNQPQIQEPIWTLIGKGFGFDESRLAAVKLAVLLVNFSEDPDHPQLGPVLTTIINFCLQYAAAGAVPQLQDMAGVLIENNDTVIWNTVPIFQAFVPLIGRPFEEVPGEVQHVMTSIIDAGLEFEETVESLEENGDLIIEITERYFKLAEMSCDPNDEIEMSLVNVFEQLCIALCDSDTFIAYLLTHAVAFFGNPGTKAAILVALGYAFDESENEALLEGLDMYANMLAEGINDASLLVRGAAAFGIGVGMAQYVPDYFDLLAGAVVRSLDIEMSMNTMRALGNLFKNATNTDSVFATVYPYLKDKIAAIGDSVDQQYLLRAMSYLCANSKVAVKACFDEVFQVMQTIMSHPDLASEAITCLGSMASVCKEQFASKTLEFAAFLASQITNEDEEIRVLVLTTIGKLSQSQAIQLAPMAPQLVDGLLGLGVQAGETLEGLVEEMRMMREQGNLMDDGEEMTSGHAIPAIALSVVASMAKCFPQIIEPNLDRMIAGIQTQVKGWVMDTLSYTCKAMHDFMEAASAADIKVMEIGSHFIEIMIGVLNSCQSMELASNCFVVLGCVFSRGVVQSIVPHVASILETFEAFLTYRLPFQEQNDKNYYEVHDDFRDTMKDFINKLGTDAVAGLQRHIPIIINHATGKSKQYRAFALSILGELIDDAGAALDDAFKANVLQIAIAEVNRGSGTAAYTINQMTNGAPHIVAARAGDILQVCANKLCKIGKKANPHLDLTENIICLLGELTRNVLHDSFPIQQFLEPCLFGMPATQAEHWNFDMYVFYLWLAEKTGGVPHQAFARAAVRLLKQPREDIETVFENDLVPQIVTVMKATLSQLPNAGELIPEWCEGDPFAMQRIQEFLAQ